MHFIPNCTIGYEWPTASSIWPSLSVPQKYRSYCEFASDPSYLIWIGTSNCFSTVIKVCSNHNGCSSTNIWIRQRYSYGTIGCDFNVINIIWYCNIRSSINKKIITRNTTSSSPTGRILPSCSFLGRVSLL